MTEHNRIPGDDWYDLNEEAISVDALQTQVLSLALYLLSDSRVMKK